MSPRDDIECQALGPAYTLTAYTWQMARYTMSGILKTLASKLPATSSDKPVLEVPVSPANHERISSYFLGGKAEVIIFIRFSCMY